MKRFAKKQRGIALITALLMTVIFLVLIGALMAQMIAELQDVGAHSNSAKALNAAYAGVENMVLQIEENASGPGHIPPVPISYSYPSPSTEKYDVTVTTTWNSTKGLVFYQIASTGTETRSGQTRSVQAIVKSFPYSYYEQFTAGNSGNVYYVTGEKFDGPVYNGGAMNVWYQDPAAPIFNNSVETTVSANWFEGAGKAATPYANVKWGDVMQKGATQFKIGANPIQLPTFKDNLTVSSEAFFGNATNNAALPGHPPYAAIPGNGVYINQKNGLAGTAGALQSGIYMQGNVIITPCSGTCGSYSGNNEVFTLTTTGGVKGIGNNYILALDFSGSGTTTLTQTSGCAVSCSITYTGTPSGQPPPGPASANGAIFVNGDVTLNTGTIHGSYTIAVPSFKGYSSNTITLGGGAPGILYKDQSSTSTDELGVWADNIKVNSSTTTGYEFDGSILTGYYGLCPGATCTTDGTFSNVNWNGAKQGQFTFFGGLIQNINGAMGVSSGGMLQHGFSRNYKYDARLASNPPPFFPITNRYDIIAWLDEGH